MRHESSSSPQAGIANPPLLQTLLERIGLYTHEHAERFLAPDFERDTHDPFLMPDMEKVCARIAYALTTNERIALWSDYDMDGIPGAVVLWDLFHKLGHRNIVHYTPHRNRDGFGLNARGLETLHHEGVSLVITIDCGIGDVEQVAFANTLGLTVIVTDHHLPGSALPEAFAIVNPKRADSVYPEPMLCGAGVAFKLAQALLTYQRRDERFAEHMPQPGWERWLLDMVGMATIADMVPLVGENRAFAHFGLVVLRKSRRPGLQALLKKARARQQYLTEEDIGFTIAPRVNAASRMGHAQDAFRLLVADDEAEAQVLADELERINAARKGHVAAMVKEARMRLESRQELRSVIVLGNPAWKPSLLGLVAGTLAEEYERPVFLWGREEGVTIKGSCRSYGGANVFALMQKVETRFIECGGHAFSGGFSIEEAHLFTLEDALVEANGVAANEEESMTPEPIALSPEEVSWATFRTVQRCAPFGVGNPRPLFRIGPVMLTSARAFGKTGEHLELTFTRKDGSTMSAIAFFTPMSRFACAGEAPVLVEVDGYLEASYFKRSPELRLRLVSLRALGTSRPL